MKICKIVCIFAICLGAFALTSCTDSQKYTYHPKDRDELVELVRDESIKLNEIDTSAITDMSYLFARFSIEQCHDLFAEHFKHIESFVILTIEEQAAQKGENYAPTDTDRENIRNNFIAQWETRKQKCIYNARERTDFSGIDSWDTSKVKDMSYMFGGVEEFDQPLKGWNVSSVQNMNGMFIRTALNQPLDSWDTSNVEDMGAMFGKSAFNQPLNAWNVSKVKDMSFMFYESTHFNQPLNDWDISQVVDMNFMFQNAKSFKQNLESWGQRLNPQVQTHLMFKDSLLESNPPKWYKELDFQNNSISQANNGMR